MAENRFGPGQAVLPPVDLGERGRVLWSGCLDRHPLTAAEQVILHEACRIADRLDGLHPAAVSDPVGPAAAAAVASGRVLSALLAALRLPDPVTGRRPGRRPPRGAYGPRAG
ncbi:MAG: hypothetical protein WKF51_13505 [Geodermatophilaceae bacterium]